jgi:hypothetical protein
MTSSGYCLANPRDLHHCIFWIGSVYGVQTVPLRSVSMLLVLFAAITVNLAPAQSQSTFRMIKIVLPIPFGGAFLRRGLG